MQLRNRTPALDTAPPPGDKTHEHVDDAALAVVSWLNANRVDYVVVGAVARVVRGDGSARGPVAIVPAPYGRNLDRLRRALSASRARMRRPAELGGPGSDTGSSDSAPVRLTAERLIDAERLTLRCGSHDLDIEGQPTGAPRYQELLYDAAKIELAAGVAVEIASAEDVERYAEMQRSGVAPEIRVLRTQRAST